MWQPSLCFSSHSNTTMAVLERAHHAIGRLCRVAVHMQHMIKVSLAGVVPHTQHSHVVEGPAAVGIELCVAFGSWVMVSTLGP